MPNMYARGILFGQMTLELGDTSIVMSESTGISCTVDFKTKVCPTSFSFARCITDGPLVGLFLGHIQCSLRQSEEWHRGRGRDIWPVESPNGVHQCSSTSALALSVPSCIAKLNDCHFTLCRPVKNAHCLTQKRPGLCQKSSNQNRSKNQTNHGGGPPLSSSCPAQTDRHGGQTDYGPSSQKRSRTRTWRQRQMQKPRWRTHSGKACVGENSLVSSTNQDSSRWRTTGDGSQKFSEPTQFVTCVAITHHYSKLPG
jgi:hypothetical protein